MPRLNTPQLSRAVQRMIAAAELLSPADLLALQSSVTVDRAIRPQLGGADWDSREELSILLYSAAQGALELVRDVAKMKLIAPELAS